MYSFPILCGSLSCSDSSTSFCAKEIWTLPLKERQAFAYTSLHFSSQETGCGRELRFFWPDSTTCPATITQTVLFQDSRDFLWHLNPILICFPGCQSPRWVCGCWVHITGQPFHVCSFTCTVLREVFLGSYQLDLVGSRQEHGSPAFLSTAWRGAGPQLALAIPESIHPVGSMQNKFDCC